MENQKATTIKISRETKLELDKLKLVSNETYENILKRLLIGKI